MNELEDWTINKDKDIKYFSGKATYYTQFMPDEVPISKNIYLDIGKANIMANIKVNGKYLGGLWTAPWKLDITNYLVKGENTLAISVVNLWVNQLIIEGKKKVEDKKTWTLIDTQTNNMSLQPSGLVGPVKLLLSY